MIESEDNFLLLKDLFPESWSENPEFSKYINELCSYGITKLYNEPNNLADERAQILSETQKLAFNNYKTFIQTADCCKLVFQDFEIVGTCLDEMLNKLGKLQTSYAKFISEAAIINSNRKLNSMTLLKHPQLLEILELSQLMDTCIRNSYYDEALELAEYSRRLANRHSNIPVICNIVEEIKGSMDMMLRQLLGQLRHDLQLPTCLRVIGYLRRMNVFTELELRLKFLQIRGEWFNNTMKSIPNDDPYHHISKTIELSRVHLFDVVTQYRAIFSDDEYAFIKDAESDNSALFHSWIVLKISEFLETLESDVRRGVGNHLDSLLGQCMYFGLSFGRVGLDFRNLMVPIFQDAIQNMLTTSLDVAERKLDESLKVYSLLGGSSNSHNFILPLQPANSLQAPSILMEFPPLAIYCNDLLLTFNNLRLCMPLGLAIQATCILQASLTNVSTFLLTFHRVDESTFNAKELEAFGRLCDVFARHLLPFINICLSHLFPSSQLTNITASSASVISKAMVGVLDIETIILPIKHLIPQISIIVPKLDSNIQMSNFVNKNVNVNESDYLDVKSLANDDQINIPLNLETNIGKDLPPSEIIDDVTREQFQQERDIPELIDNSADQATNQLSEDISYVHLNQVKESSLNSDEVEDSHSVDLINNKLDASNSDGRQIDLINTSNLSADNYLLDEHVEQ